MTGNNTKLRAVTLAALMVLSVMVGSIAFAGAAAASNHAFSIDDATHYDDSTDGEVIEVVLNDSVTLSGNERAEVTFEDGSTENFTTITNNGARVSVDTGGVLYNNISTVQIYNLGPGEVDTEAADVTFAPTTVTPGSSGTVEAYSGANVAIEGTEGDSFSIEGPSYDKNRGTGANSEVFVLNTDDFETGNYTVENSAGDSATLKLEDLGLSVSASDTTTDENVTATVVSDDINHDVEAVVLDSNGDAVSDPVTENVGSNGEVDFTFDTAGDLSAGNYTVEVTDVNTGVTAESDTFTVAEPGDVRASFAADLAQVPQGDIAWFTVNVENTDTASLTIGSEDVNYVENVTLVDEDGDGKVTVGFNTYAAGNSDADVVTTKGDEDTATIVGDQTTLSDILDTGSYDMSVVGGDGNFDGEAQDLATLSIQPRQTIGHTVYTAPSSTDIDAVVSDGTLTERSDITTSDYQVHQIEATGIFGLLANQSGDDAATQLNHAVDNGTVSLTAEEQNPGSNQDPLTFNYTDAYDADAVHVVADADNNSLYVVVDADAEVYENGDGDLVAADAGDNFNATFSVNEASGLTGEDGESVYADYNVVEPDTELNVNDDDVVVVNPGEGQAISGSTNLAPGTAFNLRVQSESNDAPFIKTASELTVQADGTFSGSFDFSDVPVDTEFSVSARTGGSPVADASGVVQEEQTTTTTTEQTTTTTEQTTTTEETTTTEQTTTEQTTEPPETTTETTEEETPGFGVVVGLIAMLGAALLALRREN